MRGYRFIIILLSLVFLAGVGFYFENSTRFLQLKNALQTDSISTGILNYGPMGKILKRLDYVRLIENDDKRFRKTTDNQDDLEVITFQKKRKVDQYLYQATPSHAEYRIRYRGLESDIKEKKGWPILSIVADEKYLYDPEIGIIANRDKRGRDWERKAQVSLIGNGSVVFESSAGLRIHGGKRRIIKPYNSFRLHFRDEYGVEKLPDDLLFENNGVPIKTLVVHTTDWPPGYPFNNPLAYDIANRIGCLAPQTSLVELYLNHKSMGMGFVTEHFSKRQWQYHIGHKNFAFYKFRGDFSLKDKKLYHRLFWKNTTADGQLSMENVGEVIDLDNLSRQIFAWAFCGTTDYCQGVGVYDYDDPKAKLYWLTWDMDHSFYDIGAVRKDLSRRNWQQPAFKMFYFKGGHKCGRTKLFSRLMDESPEYRREFISLISGLLNHRLTKEFLFSRVSYYEEMLKNFGDPHPEYVKVLYEFVDNRPDFIREDMVKYFQLNGPFEVKLSVPDGTKTLVDGYPESGPYSGKYFSGYSCIVEIIDSGKEVFSHWMVNGKKAGTSKLLNIPVDRDTDIEAVYFQD